MKTKLLLSAAIIGLMSGPTWAGCVDELAKLESAVVTAETGASTDASGMEPTKHQQQVMSGDKSDKAGAETAVTDETTASTGGQVEATSPHQQEVTGQSDAKSPDQMLKQASEMAKSGDEAGCMQKLSELKSALGEK
jgi:hypothetical protein